MKKFIPLFVLLLGGLYIASTLLPPREPTAFDVAGFGDLPILVNGRMKPIDTAARTSLLLFQGRQTVVNPDGNKVQPSAWLLDVFFHSEAADKYRVFEIVHPDVLAMFELKAEDGDAKKRFSYADLIKKIPELERQIKLARPIDAQLRTPFQKAVVQLYGALVQYQQLKHTLAPPTSADFLGEVLRFQEMLPAGVAAVRAKQAGQPHDEATAKAMIDLGQKYLFMSEVTNFLAVPPAANVPDDTAWQTTGQSLLGAFQRGSVDSSVLAFAGLAHSWREQKPTEFNKLIELYMAQIQLRFGKQIGKADTEARFNAAAPFYSSMTLYVIALLLALFSWLKWPDMLGRSAYYLVGLAWIVTTVGIGVRMWLEGRPPVTNLYSSALFVGWGSVGLCLVLEAIYKNAIGSVAAGLIGFATLLVAHHLSLAGDTLELMRAVLDSNFWLATHVIIITMGYSANYLAGFLAIIYILRGGFTRTLDKATADSLNRMVYGIVCFGTLFSFVGTVLGGIWADQSWGRFWGWDPKENGALIIVLWNALILHARWGGLVKARGLMALAVFGNVVTSWSWFGTNMLGVGLHSYGFTEGGFFALSLFVASQLVLIAIALRPLAKWRSFQTIAG